MPRRTREDEEDIEAAEIIEMESGPDTSEPREELATDEEMGKKLLTMMMALMREKKKKEKKKRMRARLEDHTRNGNNYEEMENGKENEKDGLPDVQALALLATDAISAMRSVSKMEKRMADLEQDAFDWEDELKRKDAILEKIFELYLPEKDMESTIKNVEARIKREKKKDSEEAARKAMKELDTSNEEEEESEESETEKQSKTSAADRDARKKQRDEAKAAREKEKKARKAKSTETKEGPIPSREIKLRISESHHSPIKLRIPRSRMLEARDVNEKESTGSEERSKSTSIESSPEDRKRRIKDRGQREKAEEDKKRAEMMMIQMKENQRLRRDSDGTSAVRTGGENEVVPAKQMRRSPSEEDQEPTLSLPMRSLLMAVDAAIEGKGEGREAVERSRSPSIEFIEIVPAEESRRRYEEEVRVMEERERKERDEANRRESSESSAGPSRGGDERTEGAAFVNQRQFASGEDEEMRERGESVDTRNMQNMRLEDEPMDQSRSGRASPDSAVHSSDGPIDEAEGIIGNVEENNEEAPPAQDEEPATAAQFRLYRAKKDALYDMDEINISNFENYLHANPMTSEQKMKNLKFLAKYGLIYQEVECVVCKKKTTLMKKESTDPARDGFVWQCTKCRDVRQRTVEVSVRTGCFFDGINFSIGRIMHTACMFMENPRRSLLEFVEFLDSDIFTMSHLRSYFLDISQALAFVNADKKKIGGRQKPLVDVQLGYVYRTKYDKATARNFSYVLVFKGVVEFAIVHVKNLDADTLARAAAKALHDGSEVTVVEPELFGSVERIQASFDQQSINKFGQGRMTFRSDATRYPAEDVEELRRGCSTRAQLALVDVVRENLQTPFNAFLAGMSAYDVLEKELECGDDNAI